MTMCSVCVCAEIEMVVMEKCKISDVSMLTEQNITDEEKTAAAGAEAQKSRWLISVQHKEKKVNMSLKLK